MMRIKSCQLFFIAAASFSSIGFAISHLGLAGDAFAQGFPVRPVRIIVPFAPGGSTDTLTRLIAPKMSEILGQQVVVENRGGGASQIGTDLAAKAAPNGYTILNVDTSFTSNPSLFPKLPYDSLKDFAPISLLAAAPVTLVIHPSVPAKTLKELLVLAKSRPKLFNFATGSIGSATHLGVAQFKSASGIDLVEISYKSGGLATMDVLAGQVVMMFGGPSSLAQHVANGRLRAIAVTGSKRIAALPDTPTFSESGMNAVDASSYFGSLAPANTPVEIVSTLGAAMQQVLQMPDIRQRLSGLGIEAIGSTPEQFGENLRAEMAKWRLAVKAANIRVE